MMGECNHCSNDRKRSFVDRMDKDDACLLRNVINLL